MLTDYDIENMAKACKLSPRTCGERGSVVEGMTPLCLKEWEDGDGYHPFCYNKMLYTVKFAKVNSVNIQVSANSEEEACDKAWCAWMASIEPDMEVVRVE